MKKIILIVITTLCVALIVACGAREEAVNLEKKGVKYSTDQGVDFYYPNDYVVNLSSTDKNTIEFSKENNTLYFTVIKDDTDNLVDGKDELYAGELEQNGATSIEVSIPVLDSGLSVYQYSYVYGNTGIRVMEIVYFGDDSTYVYGYRAIKDDFDKNQKDMKVYLQSFSKATGK